MEIPLFKGEMDTQDVMEVGSSVSKVSFKDSLMGTQSIVVNGVPQEDDSASNDKEVHKDEDEEDCHVICLSKVEKARLRRPW